MIQDTSLNTTVLVDTISQLQDHNVGICIYHECTTNTHSLMLSCRIMILCMQIWCHGIVEHLENANLDNTDVIGHSYSTNSHSIISANVYVTRFNRDA